MKDCQRNTCKSVARKWRCYVQLWSMQQSEQTRFFRLLIFITVSLTYYGVVAQCYWTVTAMREFYCSSPKRVVVIKVLGLMRLVHALLYCNGDDHSFEKYHKTWNTLKVRPVVDPRGGASKTYPLPTLTWRGRMTPPNVICGNHKNYHKPKFQFLSIFYLSKPNQINKGGSFEDQICLYSVI